jgi:hypothetical protein
MDKSDWNTSAAVEHELTADNLALLDRLAQFNIYFVLDKLVADGRVQPEEVKDLEREFKRFMALAGFGVCPLAMISPRVDDLWHQFLLFTRQYRAFCFSTIGEFVGHQPDTPSTPIPVVAGENFLSAYRHYFGEIPSIWFDGMNEETRNYYCQSKLVGSPPTAWSGWTGPE